MNVWFGTLRRLRKESALLLAATAALAVGVPAGAAGIIVPAKTGPDQGEAVADIAVDVSDSSDPVRVGENFHYSIRVRNLGPDDATGVQLTDALPQSFELVSWTGAKSCTRDGDVRCELNDVSHNGSATVILHVRATEPGTFTDTATASSAASDPNRDNNRDDESTEVRGTSSTGETSHLIVVDHVVNDNGGKSTAKDFELAVVGASPSPAQFNGAEAPGTDVTLTAGSYQVSQETALGYATTLSAGCAGTIQPGETKTCSVSNDDLGAVTLAIAAAPPTVQAGATTTYTVTLANPNSQSVGVSSIGVTLPNGFSYRADSTSGASTSNPQIAGAAGGVQTLTWTGPITIAAKSTATLTFAANASPTPGAYSAVVQGTIDAPFSVEVTKPTAPVTVVAAGPGQTPPPGDGSSGQTTPSTSTSGSGAVPPPVFQKSADVEPVSGEVLVREPGSADFVPLTTAEQVRFGAEIDTTAGRVKVSTVDAKGTIFHADFYEGRFLLRDENADGVTVLQLSGSDFTACKKSAKRVLAAEDGKKPKKHAKKKKKNVKKVKHSKKVVRHLWGSGTGKFRTRGRYIAATVAGTTWLTEDRCDGTRTYVQEGVISARDLVKHKTIRLGAGQSYVARPRR
jgi:uncharacterized repeat protein (TIGR01451 family)